jgi:glycosyltransferase involved in cell wall biosynthesis
MKKQIFFVYYRLDSLGSNRESFLERLNLYGQELSTISGSELKFIYWSKVKSDSSLNHLKSQFQVLKPIFSMLTSGIVLAREFKKHHGNCTVILGDNFQSWIAVEIAKVMTRKRIYMQASFHGDLRHSETKSVFRRKIKYIANRILMKRIDSIRVVNQLQKNYLESIGINGVKVSVLPVPFTLLPLAIETAKRNLGFIGRIHEERGIEEWAKIANICKKRDVIDKVIVAGDGGLRNEFLGSLSEFSDQDISYMGYIQNSQLGKYYKSIDILLSSAPSESYGMAIREALSAGVNVVARCNSTTQVIEKESFGLLRTYKSIEEAVELILATINRRPYVHEEFKILHDNFEIETKNNMRNLVLSWDLLDR